MDVDVKKVSADLFRQAASVAGGSNETTPTTIGPEIVALCESINADPPVIVPVCKDPNGLYGFCNVGVLEKVKVDGGTIRFGWNIWEYPGVYLTAEFHAVWVDPVGNLVDITPKPDGETRIVFGGDRTYPHDFDFTKRPNNRRARIYQPADQGKLAQERIATFSASQVAYETKRATHKGLTLEQWIESRLPIDPLPDLIDTFIRDADERESLIIPVSAGLVKTTNQPRLNELILKQRRTLAKIHDLLRQTG
jgi:hypothetical protein